MISYDILTQGWPNHTMSPCQVWVLGPGWPKWGEETRFPKLKDCLGSGELWWFRGDGRFSFPKKVSGSGSSGMLWVAWRRSQLERTFPSFPVRKWQSTTAQRTRAPGQCRWSRNPPWVSTCFNQPLGWSWDPRYPRLKMDGAPHSVGLCAAHDIELTRYAP